MSFETLDAVDVEMERLLNTAYADVLELLQRNRAAYDELIEALTTGPGNTLSGEQVRCGRLLMHACMHAAGSCQDSCVQPGCSVIVGRWQLQHCDVGGLLLQVRAIVEEHGCRADLDRRALERAAFL